MIKTFLIPLVALSLGSACSERSKTNEEFLACWGGQPAANGMTRIQFEAVDYPRAGILSWSAACPGLLLHLQFDNNLPSGLRLDPRRVDALDLHGFRGIAVVFVVSRDTPDRMTARVHRVIQSEIPPDAESRAIVERQRSLRSTNRSP
jgi:hypothetical protein